MYIVHFDGPSSASGLVLPEDYPKVVTSTSNGSALPAFNRLANFQSNNNHSHHRNDQYTFNATWPTSYVEGAAAGNHQYSIPHHGTQRNRLSASASLTASKF